MPHRVLWLIKGLGLGGAERLLVSMASRIDRDRFEIEAAYVLRSDDAFVGSWRSPRGADRSASRGRGTLDPRWVRNLRTAAEPRRYHLVHTHSPVPAVAARLLAPSATRFVHTEHNTWPSYAWPTFVANAATFPGTGGDRGVGCRRGSIAPPPGCGDGRQPPVEVLHHGVDLSDPAWR
jgi:hypothetical protein